MSSKYIMNIGTLVNTFSVVDSGNNVRFKLERQGNMALFDSIEQNDKVLGYVENNDNGIKYVFNVEQKIDDNTVILKKEYENYVGAHVSDEMAEEIRRNTIINIEDEIYKSLVRELSIEVDDNTEVPEDSVDERNCFDVERQPRTSKRFPLNFIIYGAPGTGKTYSTVEYALAILEDREVDLSHKDSVQRRAAVQKYKDYQKNGQIVFTTFHQNYGYEEFIQGLRPDTSSDKLSFAVVDGVFKKVADKALFDLENNYVIVIDEINRANISKVFGELITLIESDKRWGEIDGTSASLQSGDVFAVPNNLYIVGTMNSADKSISLIDAALRRRFEFIEQCPDSSLIEDTKLRDIFEKINSRLVNDLESTDLLVGHSYFMNRNFDEDVIAILNNAIIPLLYEYYYDNRKKVKAVLDEAIRNTGVSIVDNTMGRLQVKKD